MKRIENLGRVLSKPEQKEIHGGNMAAPTSCSMTWKDSGGVWHTEQGSCSEKTGPNGFGNTIHIPYCSTASFTGPVELSSNGGVSKCGPSYVTLW